MTGLLNDLRFGFRTLLKAPSFTVIAVLTLALGIGANGAVFSVVSSLLLRPYAFPQLDQLVLVRETGGPEEQGAGRLTPADYADVSRDGKLFQGAAAFQFHDFNLGRAGEVENSEGYTVSPNLFDLVGVKPAIGRVFTADEATPGNDRVVLLNYAYWQRRFGGDSNMVGSTILVDGKACTVIGIMPRLFNYPLGADIWMPLALTPEQAANRSKESLYVLARLQPGVSLRAAQSGMAAIAANLQRVYPNTNARRSFSPLRLREEQYKFTAPLFLMLQAAAFFVLLLAAGNVGNLVLMRAIGRQRELAVRTALGAKMYRLLQLFASESLLLCAAAGAAAALASVWSVKAIRGSLSAGYSKWLAGWDTIAVDSQVLAFGVALIVLIAALFGVGMSLHASRLDINRSLKEGGGTATSTIHSRLRAALVVTQVVMAVVLLVGAGLMIRGFTQLQTVFNGLDPAHMLRFETRLSSSRYTNDVDTRAFFDKLLAGVSAMPGVRAAAVISNPPASNVETPTTFFTIQGRPALRAAEQPSADLQATSADVFRILNLRLIEGRTLSAEDGPDSTKVAVVSQVMAQRFWPNASPIGQQIRLGGEQSSAAWLTVVGVVGDIKVNWFDAQPHATIYVPYTQSPERSLATLVRAAGDPNAIAPAVHQLVWRLDPATGVAGIQSLEREANESLAPVRLIGILMFIFGAVALVLSAVGVYGTVGHSVAERMHEFGIRMALGAQGGDLLNLVLRSAMKMAVAGLVLGLALALALTLLVSSRMYGIIGLSGLVFGEFALLLLAVAFVASYLPARRAARVDPIRALRCG